ncbi:hypothetical protein PBAC_16890 [Pedobacter glucosidilyticus]|nr:hypothetical protein [Pedobacter glucosidilyticus]KHJ38148.1 hypothetical protein PBAC_16890 [Pedobacter glucosidilyticus]
MEKLNKSLIVAEESVQTIPVGILFEGSNRRIKTVNKALLKLFKIIDNPKDLIGINSDLLIPRIQENFRKKVKFDRFVNQCILDKTEKSLDLESTNDLTIRIHYTSLYLEDEFISHNWFFYCINEHAELPINISQHHKTAFKKPLSNTSVTHDIRNHISCINSSVELLELIDFRNPHESSIKYQKHFEDIKDQALRILQIINNT